MRITCIGSGAILTSRISSSFLIDDRVLIDIPNGGMKALRRLDKDPSKIDLVLVSHLHADHFFDAVFLLLENGLRAKRGTPLVIVGPTDTENRLSQLFDLAYPESKTRVWGNCMPHFVSASDGDQLSILGYQVTPFAVVHSGMEAYGYLVEDHLGKRVAFTGDTEPCAAVEQLVSKADLSFVDCAFAASRSGHLGVDDVRSLHETAQGTIIGTHVSTEVRDISPTLPFEVCDDGNVYHL